MLSPGGIALVSTGIPTGLQELHASLLQSCGTHEYKPLLELGNSGACFPGGRCKRWGTRLVQVSSRDASDLVFLLGEGSGSVH